MEFRYGQQCLELLIFCSLGSHVKKIWHVAREVTIKLMTIFIGLENVICVMRVFLSIEMKPSGTNPVLAMQAINSLTGELVYFHYLEQRSREHNLTGKLTTVELCDGDTNIAVVKFKKTKIFPKIAKIEINTLHYLYSGIRRNDRIKH